MLSYYLRLSLKSIRRTPVLSALMVIALGLGIGAFMTTYTVYHLMSGNPIPHKSDVLYAVQLDSWDPNNDPTESAEDLQPQITYIDLQYLMNNPTPALRQVGMFHTGGILTPEDENEPPFRAFARATYGTFFDMFDVPFEFGTGWPRSDDDAGSRVVVLNQVMNEQLFGGENSVGKTINLSDQIYQIVGVIGSWDPLPRFYDPHDEFADQEGIFMPYNTAVNARFDAYGNTNCWKPREGNDRQSFLNSECVWSQFWAELPEPGQAEEYLAFLDNYVREQKELGRFPRPINNFISPVMEWMDINNVVSRDNKVLVRLSTLFLIVCILNTVGILLAKFLGKGPEIALRRAMGANRTAIFTQNLFEVATIGVLGGIVGIGLAWVGLRAVETLYRGYDKLVSLDWLMLLTAIGVAVVASVIAGLYPVWRTSRLAPAGLLKTQ